MEQALPWEPSSSRTSSRPVRATLDIRKSPTTGKMGILINGETSINRTTGMGFRHEPEAEVSFDSSVADSDNFDFSARFSDADQPWSPAPMSSADELFCNGKIRPLWFISEELNHPAAVYKPPLSNINANHKVSAANSYTLSAPQYPLSTELEKAQRFVGHNNNRPPDEGILYGLHQGRKKVPSARENVEKLKANGYKMTPNEVKLRANKLKLRTNDETNITQAMVKVEAKVKVEARGRRGPKEGGGHRRNRSLSPVRVFHMDDELPRQSFQTDQSFHSAQTDDVQQDRKANKVHWTLENLLHQAESHKKQQKHQSRSIRKHQW